MEKGLESLTLAIHLASYADAEYNAYELGWIMKEHDKMELAYKIMKKKYRSKMDKEAIDELLNRE